MSQVEFSEEGVLAAAREATGGLDDFGPEEFREGLRVLLQTYDEAGYSEQGRKRSWRRVVQLDAQPAGGRHLEAHVVEVGLVREGAALRDGDVGAVQEQVRAIERLEHPDVGKGRPERGDDRAHVVGGQVVGL